MTFLQSSSSTAKPRVLIIGGGFGGMCAAEQLCREFDVTLVDTKEYFEFTPGILQAYGQPSYHRNLSFNYSSSVDGSRKIAKVKPVWSKELVEVAFDYCIVATGCKFGLTTKWGETPWDATSLEEARKDSAWPQFDERYLAGRRAHIANEHEKLTELNNRNGVVVVIGGGLVGIEWVTEMAHYYPNLELHVVDAGPTILRNLPDSARSYCEDALKKRGIQLHIAYFSEDADFYSKLGLRKNPDCVYECMGVKAANYFMPKCTLSNFNPSKPDCLETDRKKLGPGGGGWIKVNKKLQVLEVQSDGSEIPFGDGSVFAVGDCNLCSELPMIPKLCFPTEQQACNACNNIRVAAGLTKSWSEYLLGYPGELVDTWTPWGAGFYAVSLGPNDGCFVLGAVPGAHPGYMALWGRPVVLQKKMIEMTKVDEYRQGIAGRSIWYMVHHMPFIN
ncbi:hypothetical protein FOZ60_007888 [Perkinsus olseni]|uniref:FAD/NAD(P)-binding domain-containing protein n=1 Tax=Perkinsus olseni TaxID=32597 RepID=A0A7J6NKM0_PEROL|nr:hypothetical protein FOZ60_007888 [Perkinsus olseni]